ncbi:tyrosine decarboxylase MfnA [Halobellus salinus]|uniref:Tyrosine decarboxylase MfnA n=1 Tax=Halobellus salinus TaxID=931585 RepID=A0A830EJI0_9EURY|nr:tyrosine decarboxylase MfnA [Halobellus salinus]GGJ11204.1 tyrosine decarboxylase MfnA [Halobellus salinus]SMP10992.1 tyrosine decarboxylase / aspartate 1-decarboxylase [Halobellus salinus]
MQQAAPQAFDRVLSSMCTDPHPAARAAAERFLATNPGDPATYAEVADLEARAVAALGAITGLATASGAGEGAEEPPHGYVTGGGTEANLQAVRAARDRRNVDGANLVVPESAHFSFTKAADVLGVELRTVSTDADHRADTDAVAAAVDDRTALVVGVAGSTEYGRVDPIPEIADIAHDAGAYCHVDAAWGGFLLPFTDHAWGFADAPIDSLTIDPHKCGRAVIPAGGLLFRDAAGMDVLAVDTPYLESRSQASLAGTRSGAGVASTVAAIDALWPDGYRDEYERADGVARWLAGELRDRGQRVADVELPTVVADLGGGVVESLRERGWRLSRTGCGLARVVVMPHVTRKILRAFLGDLDEVR